MDQRAESEDLEGVMGAVAVEDAVAAVELRRPGAEEEASAGVRASPEATPRSLPRPQGRFPLRLAGHPLLYGSLRVRLQETFHRVGSRR